MKNILKKFVQFIILNINEYDLHNDSISYLQLNQSIFVKMVIDNHLRNQKVLKDEKN